MSITYGEAKQVLAQYTGRGGKCPSSSEVDLFVRQVLEYLLFSGQYGSLRKFIFNAVRGCFTVPYELEAPLKVKINGAIGTAWDKWFEWHNSKELEDGCVPADNALREDPNYYPTVYDMPLMGARVGVIGLCEELEDAHLIVQGYEASGREVFTVHDGKQISGEYLRIRKGQLRYTTKTFTKITGVTKTKTRGYTQLVWVAPSTTGGPDVTGFLSDYSPLEEKPSYRRYRVTSPNCGDSFTISVLGRIRLKPAYSENDYIPFDSVLALSVAGQTLNRQYNDADESATAKDSFLQNLIMKENEHKKVQNSQPVEFYPHTSAGIIKNIV